MKKLIFIYALYQMFETHQGKQVAGCGIGQWVVVVEVGDGDANENGISHPDVLMATNLISIPPLSPNKSLLIVNIYEILSFVFFYYAKSLLKQHANNTSLKIIFKIFNNIF